jgi:flagellar basal body-associated protein FliL
VPDTVLVPDNSGTRNLWVIIAVIAAVLAAGLIGLTLMSKRKKDKHMPA